MNANIPGMSKWFLGHASCPFEPFIVRHIHLIPKFFSKHFLPCPFWTFGGWFPVGNEAFCSKGWANHKLYQSQRKTNILLGSVGFPPYFSRKCWCVVLGVPHKPSHRKNSDDCSHWKFPDVDLLGFPPSQGGMITIVRCHSAMIHDPRQFQGCPCHQVEKKHGKLVENPGIGQLETDVVECRISVGDVFMMHCKDGKLYNERCRYRCEV